MNTISPTREIAAQRAREAATVATADGTPCKMWERSNGQCCPPGTHQIYCPERVRFVGENKRRHEEPVWSRHFIAVTILFMSLAFLGAVALGAVGQARYIHEIQVAGRV